LKNILPIDRQAKGHPVLWILVAAFIGSKAGSQNEDKAAGPVFRRSQDY
jgi:hypothetical protein